MVFSKFLNLEPEKQERIISAAIKEFAQKSYENASTNEIVKEAGISKGLLFHYFKNKKNMYMFLYDYCIDLYLREFYGKINLDERDIILRLRQSSAIKLELLKKYPNIFEFIEAAYFENSPVIKSEVAPKNEELINEGYAKLFGNIDTSKFKEGLDIKKIINIMLYTFNGFGDQLQKKGKILSNAEYKKLFAEFEEFIEIFKKCFYK